MSALVHGVALAIAVDPDGPLAGALLIGKPGSGKSLLALDAIGACPWRRSALVADDAVLLDAVDLSLVARAPKTIAGLIEIRGYGPAAVATRATAALVACFDLDAGFERLPEPRAFEAEGLAAPLYPFRADRPAAAAALRAILRSITGGQS